MADRGPDTRSGRLVRWLLPLVVAVAVGAAGCGGGSDDTPPATVRPSGSWSLAVCRQVARALPKEGTDALAHFRPPFSSYPPDVALLRIRLSVGGLIDNHCPPAIAGATISRGLSARERAELFPHLPPNVVRYLRRGLAES
jgi:hypothetical protein